MADEKVFFLRLAGSDTPVMPSKFADEPECVGPPQVSDIQTPRWTHWRQRKLARVWYATLLGMNIEPTVKARAALKFFEPHKYQIYSDRLDIAKTLLGYDLEIYTDHAREGETVGEKYVSLAEYYDFAVKNEWADLGAMYDGLNLASSPQKLSTRKTNNYLELLYQIFLCLTPGFENKKASESATAIMEWLKTIDAECPVSHQTLIVWVGEMNSMLQARLKSKAPKGES